MVIRLTVGLLALAAAVGTAPQAVAQSGEEMRCRAMIEGQVAWNRNGDTAWNPANIEALCAGTKDAAARVACFRAGIAAHDDWSRAIAECAAAGDRAVEQALPPSVEPQAERASDETGLCKAMFQGKVPMSLPNGSTSWPEDLLDRLCGGTPNAAETLKCFVKTLYNDGGPQPSTASAVEFCRWD
jgi:hypothetical protein